MRLFRHIPQHAPISHHVIANVAPVKENLPLVGAQHSGDYFHSGRFACPVRTEESDNLPGCNSETDILNRRNRRDNCEKGAELRAST